MNNNKALSILFGIGIILYFLASYLGSNSPIDLFFISIGILAIIFGFYTKDKKIKVTNSYIVSVFSVNIIQWLILIYIFYYNPVYSISDYLIPLIAALWATLFLANQIRKKYLKSSQTKIDMLKDKTKLILLITGVIIIIGSLIGLITYYAPIFLYGITLGLMVLVYGFYHEKRVKVPERNDIAHMYLKKDNMAINYVKVMGFLIILQIFILIYFFHQFSIDDWPLAFTLSMNIAIYFSIQIYLSDVKLSDALKIPYISDLKISNEKIEKIIEIGAVALFIIIFGAFALKI
ncbi:hypothetical protein [Methanobacterium oryzae]|uniref:hypothetical protein n=1 Tax=Methanobacterium oryzae TaxID=69540 RepID=UPI003D1CD09D